ncbi:hypothetical protein BDA99DRAFT_503067 [Phascolomyces articulosus]|uniref:Uncharacterized protein n=1 Tax=Phascolomyces articulosus TaxID=60185 RepID=A0AAD5KE00_9FUNG|nr:hypothetical protein BDA99DRAFT_503067 [Phascolomyces articulosus]
MMQLNKHSPPLAVARTIVDLVVDGVAVAAVAPQTDVATSVVMAGGVMKNQTIVAKNNNNGVADNITHLCLSYSDMSIYFSRPSLLDLVTTLRHRPNDSLTVVANINFYGNYIDFGFPSQRILSTPNAGGGGVTSLMSEAVSAEVIDRLVGISKVLTEMEIQYSTKGPITDYVCYSSSISQALGVSVTRAMAFGRRFTAKDAMRLMKKKISGINKSTLTVSNYKFQRQILHVWAENGTDAAIVRRACAKIPDTIRKNTIILITTINMDSVFASG